jgi:hypothetical protein
MGRWWGFSLDERFLSTNNVGSMWNYKAGVRGGQLVEPWTIILLYVCLFKVGIGLSTPGLVGSV